MTETEIEITPELPIGELAELLTASQTEGHRLLDRLVAEWEAGENRFDQPGEALFVARSAGALVGVCGLNRDPFSSSPSVGRLRRLYVLPASRRSGVASRLVAAALAHAGTRFATVRVRAGTPTAGQFYDRIGFTRVDDEDATHQTVQWRHPTPRSCPERT